MKHLYYVRHGESLINTGDTWGDRPGSPHDLGLTDSGRAQALQGAMAAKKAGFKPDLIVASPLLRTRETAVIFAEALGYPIDTIEYNDLLLEVQVGELEGTSFSAFAKDNTYADLGKFKGAETIEKLQKRAAKALAYLKSRPEETILVVSHSCFGRAFVRTIKDLPYTDEFEPEHNKTLPYAEPLKLV